jgi:hypothetical protein
LRFVSWRRRRQWKLAGRHVADIFCEPTMTQDTTPSTGGETDIEITNVEMSEEFDSAADHHRLAAQHFAAAARYHLAAAEADDEGDADRCARQGYQAYRHQLTAVQYAEIAAMDDETLAEALDGELFSS